MYTLIQRIRIVNVWCWCLSLICALYISNVGPVVPHCGLKNSDGPKLSTHTLVRLQEKHDFQVAKHKGNEHANVAHEDIQNSLVYPKNTKRNPRQWHKLVGVLMWELHSAPTGVSRTHLWNMSVKLDVSDVFRNSSNCLDQTKVYSKEGGIRRTNPIKCGKSMIMIWVCILFSYQIKPFLVLL